MDTVDKKTRSKIMARIGQKDTGIELLLRRALHRAGLRYRLHDRRLPGRPDLVFPRFKAVVFVHGCFWHDHGCHLSTKPKTNKKYWNTKFKANRERDLRNVKQLTAQEWRILTVWECSLSGKAALPIDKTVDEVSAWLHGKKTRHKIAGRNQVASKARTAHPR